MKHKLMVFATLFCVSIAASEHNALQVSPSYSQATQSVGPSTDELPFAGVDTRNIFDDFEFHTCQSFAPPAVGYEKYNHILFPDEIVDLIEQEKELHNQCGKHDLLAFRARSLGSVSTLPVLTKSSEDQISSYAAMCARKKSRMTDEQWKKELSDFAQERQENIKKYQSKLNDYQDGFVDVTPSHIRFLERQEQIREQNKEIYNRLPMHRKLAITGMQCRAIIASRLSDETNRGIQRVIDTVSEVGIDDVTRVGTNLAQQGLGAVGYGMRVGLQMMINAQKALEDSNQRE
jgi:hypothetical protein